MEKTLIVDWDSPTALMQLVKQLHDRHRQISDAVSKNTEAKNKLALCLEIWATPVIIKDTVKSPDKDFYLYSHFYRPKGNWPNKRNAFSMFCKRLNMSGPPFYIGKGCKDRAFNKKRSSSHDLLINTYKKIGEEYETEIFLEGLSEQEALIYEGKLIDILGQRILKNGMLVNIDKGYKYEERRESYKDTLQKLHPIYGPVT